MRKQIAIFYQSFLYFFGLAENPLSDILMNPRSDAESLRGDWFKIGNDIRKSYEVGKEAVR
ncbi:hypothetical protein [Viscerimonas tarda]